MCNKVQKQCSFAHSYSHARFNCAPCSCYVCVHFAIFWCSCQVFSLDKSFNTLFNDHRTGKESCLQLLGYLKTKTHGIKLKLYEQLFKGTGKKLHHTVKVSAHWVRNFCMCFFVFIILKNLSRTEILHTEYDIFAHKICHAQKFCTESNVY